MLVAKKKKVSSIKTFILNGEKNCIESEPMILDEKQTKNYTLFSLMSKWNLVFYLAIHIGKKWY